MSTVPPPDDAAPSPSAAPPPVPLPERGGSTCPAHDHPAEAPAEVPEEVAAARRRAVAAAVVELEGHVSSLGWDAPVMVFALVNTARALAVNPEIAGHLPPGAAEAAEADAEHLTAIEQEGLPEADTIEELLGQLAWPEAVDGAAIVVERVVVPPEAEVGMPEDPEEAIAYLGAHPDRQDVRIAVGVLRTGETWCALRSRSHDSADAVAGSPDAVPGLVAGLLSTFA